MATATGPGGVRIYYEVHEPRGDATGPALVLAHGFGVSSDMWMWQVQPLTAHHRLILWDARGHGESGGPPSDEAYSMPIFAQDLAAVLDACGEQTAVIGGMSFGGMIALQFAVDFPQRTHALVLSDTAPRGPSEARDPAETPGHGAFAAMRSRTDLTPALPALTMPALVIWGEHDRWMQQGVQRLSEGLPQRRVVCLLGCSHGTSSQRPHEWTQTVLDFLADVEAGRPIGGEVTV